MKSRISNIRLALIIAFFFGASMGARAQNNSKGIPPTSIPTFSTDDVARTGFFYAG